MASLQTPYCNKLRHIIEGKPIYRDEKHFNRHWAEHIATLYRSPWSAGSGTASERGEATRERM